MTIGVHCQSFELVIGLSEAGLSEATRSIEEDDA
jgi:hypothetical protein